MLDGYWFWGGYGSLEAPPPTHSSDEVHSTAEISPFDAILRYATTNSAKEVLALVADPESITKVVYPSSLGRFCHVPSLHLHTHGFLQQLFNHEQRLEHPGRYRL